MPLVSVICTTYNHESYIRQALDGFVIQQCNFPIEVIVHDDASTDNTAAIIKEYTAKYPFFRAILQAENQFSKGFPIWIYLFTQVAKGKYIAICEGDDYWTDPHKLQKQVDFLEANEDFAICFHAVKIKNESTNTLTDDFITREVPDVTDIYDLAKDNYIHTPSVIFRKNEEVFSAMVKLGSLPVADYVLHILNAQYGKIKKLPEKMAIYRIGVGIWSSKDEVFRLHKWLSVADRLIRFFADNEKLNLAFLQQYSGSLFTLYTVYESANDFDTAKKLFLQACVNHPEVIYNEFKSRSSKLDRIRNSSVYHWTKPVLRIFNYLKIKK